MSAPASGQRRVGSALATRKATKTATCHVGSIIPPVRIIETPHEENALAGQPKKRIPRAAQGERRSHLALRAMNLVPCPQCKNPKPPHQACPNCGMFRGRQVIPIKAARTPA
jgi:large subunit ribosomal protein L32